MDSQTLKARYTAGVKRPDQPAVTSRQGTSMIAAQPSNANSRGDERARPVVYVIDDDASVRHAFIALLRSVDLRVETFESPKDFLEFSKCDAPSCLVLDVRLHGENGLAFQERAAQTGLRMPILFMTAHGDIEMSVKAMKAGATDFIPKPFRHQDMLDAINHALKRDEERRASESVLTAVRTAYDSLTQRERQVLELVVRGLLNKQAADALHLSEITVKVYRGQLMKKMGARCLPDLVRMAVALGIHPAPVPG